METQTETNEPRKHVLVRTYAAGVFAGELKEYDRQTQHAVLLNARRLWYWEGACTLSELSQEGTTMPEECKFPMAVPAVELSQVIEILPLSEKAKQSIYGVKVWQALI